MPSSAPARDPQATAAPVNRGAFLLVGCQGGAEAVLCKRQQVTLPQLTRGAWRRGLVTFRLAGGGVPPDGFDPADDFFPDLVFARTVIRSYGQVTAVGDAERIEAVRGLVPPAAWDNIHVWPRDPRMEVATDPIRRRLLAVHGKPESLDPVARPGEVVLDCVVDEPDRWWVGWHRARCPSSCWPGGRYPGQLPADKVSRAWLKLDEAVATFAIPLEPGQRACELGAAPGGACQRLLEAGLEVVGIDPAKVDGAVAAHERFEQWRMRARDVRLRAFRGFDWIVADMNIDPTSTLESIGRIVTAPGVRPAGIIATLKLPEWSRADALPEWLGLLRGWGFTPRARQLSSGGREVCVVALRKPGRSRARPRRGR